VLDQVKDKIEDYIKSCNDKRSEELYKLLPEGKMLRSKLILKIAGVNETTIQLCAIVEMIHAASLLHDDVIDDATTRRGKPSINAAFGNKTAIMFGDILYSKAFSELSQMPNDISYAISEAVTKLSIGELLDVELTNQFNSDYDKYLDMIYKKTASLIEASAKAAAILSNKDKDKFALYGKNLGLAFQMIDDILDITQDNETLGKPAMLDFVEGKVTIPYLFLYQRLDKNDQETLISYYKKEITKEQSQWIQTNMLSTNSIKDSIKLARDIGQEAINSIKDEQNEDLVSIMKDMIEREF
jgi:octaprenyl-diphosphate synthase